MGLANAYAIVLTCEHAGNHVPREYAHLFSSARARSALETHRGYDLGALSVARSLGRRLGVPLISHEVTRLLVDVNRSIGHPRLFSEFSRRLVRADRAAVLDRYYHPHRKAVGAAVKDHLSAGRRVIHISVHSFTPRLNREVRTAEVGLLYDPSRAAEREFCTMWAGALRDARPGATGYRNNQSDWRIRRNYPYRGASDGLTTSLRRAFPPRAYLGVELELNQALLGSSRGCESAAARIAAGLMAAHGASASTV